MYEYVGENKVEMRPWVAEIESLGPMTLSAKWKKNKSYEETGAM
jgi:hypothetical protein